MTKMILASECAVLSRHCDEVLQSLLVQVSEGFGLCDCRHVIEAEPEAKLLQFSDEEKKILFLQICSLGSLYPYKYRYRDLPT